MKENPTDQYQTFWRGSNESLRTTEHIVRQSSTGIVKVEKNLASLGFFTPSHKRISGAKKKTIVWIRQSEGQRSEVRAVILPSAAYGLPVTSDQDKYLAFQKLLNDIRRQTGEVRNPIGFTTADLLRTLGLTLNAGKNYEDVVDWGKRMTLTGICSEGTVYFAGRKSWATDTFHVFERFVSLGNQMPDGTIAEQNYVWLSAWQLENINNHHLLPIDLEAYTQLKNHIAKALVPLLQVWLYATRQVGLFEKRYRDLCQILNIVEYKHPSKIKEKLGPSLNELQRHRFISAWEIQPTTDGSGFKVVFVHDEKSRSEAASQREQPQSETAPRGHTGDLEAKIEPELLHQLMKRGVSERVSISLLKNLKPGQHLMDQLEWGDYLVFHSPKKHKFYNPAGLYVHLVKENATPPETFETSRKRTLREAARHAWERQEQELAALQLAYGEYQDQQLDRFVQAHPEEIVRLVQAKKAKLVQETYWKRIFAGKQDILQKAAERQVRTDLLGRVTLMDFDEFRLKRSAVDDQETRNSGNTGESLTASEPETNVGCVSESSNR